MFAEVVAAVASSGDRLTRPRAAVAAMVGRRDGPFTAGELIREGRERERVGRATVFRTLELFERLGLLEQLDLPDGSHAYVRCRPAAHHHHVVCVECRRAVDIPESGLQRVTAEVARSTGFILEGHRLELFGLCPTCQTGRPPAQGASRG